MAPGARSASVAERFDAERLSDADLDVMRRRVSFEPWEVSAIVDKIQQLTIDANHAVLIQDIRAAHAERQELTALTADRKIFQLTKNDAEQIDETLGMLSYHIEKLAEHFDLDLD